MYITFDNPAYLWYFLSIPLLVVTHFVSLRSAKTKAMKFANFRALKRISGTRLVTKNTTVLLLRIIVLTLLILAVAGLKAYYKTEHADNNYILAIDVSSSMSAQDIPPTRLEASKRLAKEFTNHVGGNSKVGVVTFSGVTLIKQTLSSDMQEVKSAIDDISVVNAGGTDIPGAIITGTNLLLADTEKGRVIILLTDGSSTLGNFIDNSLNRSIDYVKEHKVVVHALGIGSETGPLGYLPEYYNISATYNEDNLIRLTNATGGVLLQTHNNEEITASYNKLIGETKEAYIKMNVDYGLLLAGVLLLFVEWGLINSRYRRIA